MIPQGVLHTLAGGVSLSHGALQDTFIPIQPGETRHLWVSVMERSVFFAFLRVAPLVEETIIFLWFDAVLP